MIRSLILLAVILPLPLRAQSDALTRPYTAQECPSCEGWNAPHRPVHVFGNVYYVGTQGLGSVLIASPDGHVLIDGGLPNTAPAILAGIRALGFGPEDVALILNSHVHYDHAGGIAALGRETGGRIAASPATARALEAGTVSPDDPQYGLALVMPRVRGVEVVADGQTLRVGPIAVTAHFTAGHAPGGTTWSWRSCEGDRCLDFVYADSQTPVSRDGFRFSGSDRIAAFERGFTVLERLSCDVLITPHPSASRFLERIASGLEGLIDAEACRRYAAAGRERLRQRLDREGR